PGARREAPARPRGQLEQGGELPPRRTVVVAAEEGARLGSGVDGAVGGAHRDGENSWRRQPAIDPTASAVARAPKSILAQTGVDDIRVFWIDGQTLGAAARKRTRDAPGAVAL